MIPISWAILGFIALMGLFTLAPTDPRGKLTAEQMGDGSVSVKIEYTNTTTTTTTQQP